MAVPMFDASRALTALPVVGKRDPRVDVNMPAQWQVTLGGRVYSYYATPANGNSFTQSITWQPVIPGPNFIISRQLRTMIQYQLNWTAAGGTRPILDMGTNDGPRFLPTMNAVGNVQLAINGFPLMQLMWPVLLMSRYWVTPKDSSDVMSHAYAMQDSYTDYAKWQEHGQTRNPLAAYGESGGLVNTRGGLVNCEVQQNTATAAQVLLTVIEPIFIPPLTQKTQAPGFSSIKTLTIIFNLNSTPYRIWSRAPPITTGAITVGFASSSTVMNPWPASASIANETLTTGLTGSVPIQSYTTIISVAQQVPLLWWIGITPMDGFSLPMQLQFDYSSFIPYNYDQSAPLSSIPSFFGFQKTPTLSNGTATQMFVSNTITLNTLPDEIYVAIGPQIGDLYSAPGGTNPGPASIATFNGNLLTAAPGSIYVPDFFCRILNLTMTFNNEVNMLVSQGASGNQANMNLDFYEMCRENGLQASWTDFNTHGICVLCLRPGIDFGLPPGYCPGMTGQWNLQFSATVSNPSDQVSRFSMFIVPRTFGLFSMDKGQVQTNIGVVNPGMLERAISGRTGMYWSPFQAQAVGMGGDFFDSIKKLVRPHMTWDNVVKAVNWAAPHAEKAWKRRFGAGLQQGEGADAPQGLEGDPDLDPDRPQAARDPRDGRRQGDDDDPKSGVHQETGYVRADRIDPSEEQMRQRAAQAPNPNKRKSSIMFS